MRYTPLSFDQKTASTSTQPTQDYITPQTPSFTPPFLTSFLALLADPLALIRCCCVAYLLFIGCAPCAYTQR